MGNNNSLSFNNSHSLLNPSAKNSISIDLQLTRIKKVLDILNNPCKNIPAVQIVGTNGKGSIASFLESCLIEADIKIGCTTSPHLKNWCERIRVKGENITVKEFQSQVSRINKISKNISEFELVIASALDYFSSKNVELIILEAGLGGRLDATTAHPYRPLIAIGSIGLDHCEYLGNDLKAITTEKAAVISTGSIVVSSWQEEKVAHLLEEIAYKKKAIIKWKDPLPKYWELGIPGQIQRKNAAVAKGIIDELKGIGWDINETQIKKGLKNATWPARLQKTSWRSMPILLDGAHNPHAANELAKERLLWDKNETGINWILGIQSHKKGPEMLRLLLKKNDHAWIVPVPNHKSWVAPELSKACPELSKQLHQGSDIEEILERFLLAKEWPDPCPVIAGSLFLFEGFLPKKFL